LNEEKIDELVERIVSCITDRVVVEAGGFCGALASKLTMNWLMNDSDELFYPKVFSAVQDTYSKITKRFT